MNFNMMISTYAVSAGPYMLSATMSGIVARKIYEKLPKPPILVAPKPQPIYFQDDEDEYCQTTYYASLDDDDDIDVKEK